MRSGHTYGLEHGEFPLAGEDGGHHGVDEVQDSHNADNGAQEAAQDGKGALELAEVGTVAGLALVHQWRVRGGGQVRKIAFRCRFRIRVRGIEQVE